MTLTDISIIGTEQVVASNMSIRTTVLIFFSALLFIASIVLFYCNNNISGYICLGICLLLFCLSIILYVISPDITTVYTIEIPDNVSYKAVVEEWDIQEPIKYVTNDSVICTAERNEED